MGGALARPSWLSSPTLGRANRFLSTAAVSLMTPRRPLTQPDKVKVRTLAVEQRTEEDSEWPPSASMWPRHHHHYLTLCCWSLSLWLCTCVFVQLRVVLVLKASCWAGPWNNQSKALGTSPF